MKLAKRILTAGVALALTLSLNIPAFAASITVSNPAAGETYTAYKLFDVTNNGDAYAYSTTNTSLKTALENGSNDESSGFDLTFTKAANSDTWYISGLETNEVASLAAYIETNWNATFASILGTGSQATTAEGTVTINNLESGYYYVDSSLVSLFSLNTSPSTVQVNEKNTIPSITKDVSEDGTAYADKATVDTIDTFYYKLTVNTGTNVANLGTGIDGDYIIVDTLPEGVTFNTGTVAIYSWSLENGDYTVTEPTTENGNKLTIVLDMEKLQTLAAGTNIVITYNAKATTHLTPNMNYTNTAELTYKNQKDSDTATIVTYQIKGDKENNTFTKVDGTNDNAALEGVKFALTNTNGDYAKFDESGNLTAWENIDTPAGANKLTTDPNGHIYAYGLDAGTYTLIETDPLPGYNALKDTIIVTIAEDGTVTYKLSSSTEEAGEEITIENNAGSQLPSTGGMGTTILYIAGAALVLGAGVTLVVRRRMNSDR